MSHKKGKVLSGQSREIVLAVDTYFEQEKTVFSDLLARIKLCPKQESIDFPGITVPEDLLDEIINFAKNTQKVTERVAAATQISESTVCRIKGEGSLARVHSSRVITAQKGKRGPVILLDNLDLCALRNIINSMYDAQKRVPTIANILLKAKQDFNFPGGKSTLRRIMKNKLGYKFKKCAQKGLQLTERPNIRVWRAKYLRRIRQNDALGADKKCVVYIDETWVKVHNTASTVSQPSHGDGVQKCESQENNWTIVHAGKEYGFINGAKSIWKNLTKTLHYEQMSSEIFFAWATNILLPKIPANSIIVMNNASYLSVEANKVPTLTTKKTVMQDWLVTKGIQFPSDLTKVELYGCIKQHHTQYDYDIDNLMRSHGHEVLRLPPYNCDLNPIEYMWQLVKQKVPHNDEQTDCEIEALTQRALESITSDDWSKQIEHVKKVEQQYWDKEQRDNIEEFNINTVDGSDNMSTEDETTDDDSFGENMSGITLVG